MRWFIALLLLPGSLAAVVLVISRVLRPAWNVAWTEGARDQFRREREWLEVKFLDVLARHDPSERLRWEEAQWQSPVFWARDRQSGDLLALVAVEFEPDPFDEHPDHPQRYATAVFEYHHGRWRTEGKHLNEIRPQEAVLSSRRFEPFRLPQRQG